MKMKRVSGRKRLVYGMALLLLIVSVILVAGCDSNVAGDSDLEEAEDAEGIEDEGNEDDGSEIGNDDEEEIIEEEEEEEAEEKDSNFIWNMIASYYQSEHTQGDYEKFLEDMDDLSPQFIELLWELEPYLTFSDFTNDDTMETVIVKDLKERYGEYWTIAYADKMPRDKKISLIIYYQGMYNRILRLNQYVNDARRQHFVYGNLVAPDAYRHSYTIQGDPYLPSDIMYEDNPYGKVFYHNTIRDTHADFFKFIPLLNSGGLNEARDPLHHVPDPSELSDDQLSVLPAGFLSDLWALKVGLPEHDVEVFCMYENEEYMDIFFNTDWSPSFDFN